MVILTCFGSIIFYSLTAWAFPELAQHRGALKKCATSCHEPENIIQARKEKSNLSPCKECHKGESSVAPRSPFKPFDGVLRGGVESRSQLKIAQLKESKHPSAEDKTETGKQPDSITEASSKTPPPNMVLIPAGEFVMGSNDRWDDEAPEYIENTGAFYIDIYETTNEEYKKFVDATNREVPYLWRNGEIPEGKEKHPVTYVNWFDAKDYCHWKGKRLPTEEEWEKAARGFDGNIYPWGNIWDKTKSNNPYNYSTGTMPVGSYPQGKSPFGLYDTSGNVWEWVDSFYLPHPGNTKSRPDYGKNNRVLKGGSWYDCLSYGCGLSSPTFNRSFFTPEVRNNSFGFRCARSP